jgi:hypothetical protein
LDFPSPWCFSGYDFNSHFLSPFISKKLTDAAIQQVQLMQQMGNMPIHQFSRQTAPWASGSGPYNQAAGTMAQSPPHPPSHGNYPHHPGGYYGPPPPAAQGAHASPEGVAAGGSRGDPTQHPQYVAATYLYGHHQPPTYPPLNYHYQPYYPPQYYPLPGNETLPPGEEKDKSLERKDAKMEHTANQNPYNIHASSSEHDEDTEEQSEVPM